MPPSGEESSQQHGLLKIKVFKRAQVTCLSCRKRKIKCDTSSGTCQHGQSRTSLLEEHVRKLEERLAELLGVDCDSVLTSSQNVYGGAFTKVGRDHTTFNIYMNSEEASRSNLSTDDEKELDFPSLPWPEAVIDFCSSHREGADPGTHPRAYSSHEQEDNIIYETPSYSRPSSGCDRPHGTSTVPSTQNSPRWMSGLTDFASNLYNHWVPYSYPPPTFSPWTFVIAGWVMVPPLSWVWPSWVAL